MSCLYSNKQKKRQSVLDSSVVCIPRDLCLVVSSRFLCMRLCFVRFRFVSRIELDNSLYSMRVKGSNGYF